MDKQYHHGNLRQSLIDAGIRIMNESGEEGLSLRKVAARCGVSHAAPYAHFKDKEALLLAMKESVTEIFTKELEIAIATAQADTAEAAIFAMGKRYILFFREHPDYFHFLFYKQKIRIHTRMDHEEAKDYQPFLILRRLYGRYLQENHIEKSQTDQEIELLKSWAVVQGFASIACMENVEITLPWEQIIPK